MLEKIVSLERMLGQYFVATGTNRKAGVGMSELDPSTVVEKVQEEAEVSKSFFKGGE